MLYFILLYYKPFLEIKIIRKLIYYALYRKYALNFINNYDCCASSCSTKYKGAHTDFKNLVKTYNIV